MMRTSSSDLDYLTTRLHARRSRMAEAERLDELCRLRSVSELARALFPGTEISAATVFQRRLVQTLISEISSCLKHLEAEEQDFIAWLLVRFQVENAKVLLRAFLNQIRLEATEPLLLSLPPGLRLDAPALLSAKSPADFAALLPAGSPRNRLQALLAHPREPQPFLLEAALDAGYFHELLTRHNRLPGGELEIIKPLVAQEINLFEFMLVVRGRFHFGLPAESLLPLRVFGGGELGAWFDRLMAAPDLSAAVNAGDGVVWDPLPPTLRPGGPSAAWDVSDLEAAAWQRYLRLANSAFRRSHNGVGAVAGYFAVRRMEIANLITLSECLRLGVDAAGARERLLPRSEREVAHV
jgi:vacuolar-type H+-ATPase subunit C/Vma6